jgi:hypothetical protein
MKKTLMFEKGEAEMWCNGIIEFGDLLRLGPLKIADQSAHHLPCLKEKLFSTSSFQMIGQCL